MSWNQPGSHLPDEENRNVRPGGEDEEVEEEGEIGEIGEIVRNDDGPPDQRIARQGGAKSPIHGDSGYGSMLNNDQPINPHIQHSQSSHPPPPPPPPPLLSDAALGNVAAGGPNTSGPGQRRSSWGPRPGRGGVGPSSFNTRPPVPGRTAIGANRHSFGSLANGPPPISAVAQRSQSLSVFNAGGSTGVASSRVPPPGRPTDPRFRGNSNAPHGNNQGTAAGTMDEGSLPQQPFHPRKTDPAATAGNTPPRTTNPPPPPPPRPPPPPPPPPPLLNTSNFRTTEPNFRGSALSHGGSQGSINLEDPVAASKQCSSSYSSLADPGFRQDAQPFNGPEGEEMMRNNEMEEFGFRGGESNDFRGQGEEFRLDPPFRGASGGAPDAAGRGPPTPLGLEGFHRELSFGNRDRRLPGFRGEAGAPPQGPPFGMGGRVGGPGRGAPAPGKGGMIIPGLPNPGRGGSVGGGQNQVRGPETESYYGPAGSAQDFRRSPVARGRFGGRGGRGLPTMASRGGSFSAGREPLGTRNPESRFGVVPEYGAGADAIRTFDSAAEDPGSKVSFASMADRPSFPQERPSYRPGAAGTSVSQHAEGAPSDLFGRIRDWSGGRSPQSSPVNRKKVRSFNLSEDGSGLDQPKTPTSTAAAEESVSSKATTETEDKPIDPPPLRTNALGEGSMARAEKAIGILHEIIGDKVAAPDELDSSKLPAKQVLFEAMTKLDQTMKQNQDLIAKKTKEMEEEKEKEEKERAMAKEKAIADAKSREEQRVQRLHEMKEAEAREKVEELERLLKEGNGLLEGRREKFLEDFKEELKLMVSREEEAMNIELNAQILSASEGYDHDLQQARRSFERFSQAVSRTEAKIAGVEADLNTKMAKARKSPRPKAVSTAHIVHNIIEENRRKAAEAHVTLFAAAPSVEVSGKPEWMQDVQKDLEWRLDPREGKSSIEWAEQAQQVTGLADALYSKPSEAPYYQFNEDTHQVIGPLITEYIRDGRKRLRKEFIDLAMEYEYRRDVFSNKWKKRAAEAKARTDREPISSLVPRQAVVHMRESDGGRPATQNQPSTSNPYRRARRGNEIRTEYEQEQIMAEIAAKEAMEKKILFGGSALPRQRGELERRTTAQFFQSFISHRFDPADLEAEIAITNVWTDMEKCIFLDRFMHHPKDFRKIASFLRNKSTLDCVAFYYDSKQTVPYKAALKEFIMRRKRRGDYQAWDATIQAALSVGSIIKAGPSEEKPLVFLLPKNEDAYVTSRLHPMRQEMFQNLVVDEKIALEAMEGDKSEGNPENRDILRKRLPGPLFVLDHRETKHLKTAPPERFVPSEKAPQPEKAMQQEKPMQQEKAMQPEKPIQQEKTILQEKPIQQEKTIQQEKPEKTLQQEKVAQPDKVTQPDKANYPQNESLANPGSEDPEEADDTAKPDLNISQVSGAMPRRAPQKWTTNEKNIFLETLEKHGRDWELLARAVGTKTTPQIKNFYYDYKKQLEKKKDTKKPSKAEKTKKREDLASPTPASVQSNEAPLSPADPPPQRDDCLVQKAGPSNLMEENGSEQSIARPLLSDQKNHSTSGIVSSSRFNSGSSTPVPSSIPTTQQELWAQSQRSQHQQGRSASSQQHRVSEDVARLLRQHPQSHHKQLVSSFLPWVVSSRLGSGDQHGGGQIGDLEQQQHLQVLLQLQQQHQLQSLNLSNFPPQPSGIGFSEQAQHHHQPQHHQQIHRQQQDHHRQQQLVSDDRIAALQQLIGNQGGVTENPSGPSQTSSSFALLAHAIQQRQQQQQQSTNHGAQCQQQQQQSTNQHPTGNNKSGPM